MYVHNMALNHLRENVFFSVLHDRSHCSPILHPVLFNRKDPNLEEAALLHHLGGPGAPICPEAVWKPGSTSTPRAPDPPLPDT